VEYHLTEGQLNGPAEIPDTDGLRAHLGRALPESYIQFLRAHDGGEGFIGIFLFATNGGGEGYGFDTVDPASPIVQIPLIGMDRQCAVPVASDLPALFARLVDHDD